MVRTLPWATDEPVKPKVVRKPREPKPRKKQRVLDPDSDDDSEMKLDGQSSSGEKKASMKVVDSAYEENA